MKIQFNINPRKVIEAMVWCLEQDGPKDILFVLKWLYYIDKYHIQKYGRPVTGDSYIHLKHGPTPAWAYDALQGKISDSVLADIVADAFTIRSVSGEHKKMIEAKRSSDNDYFSLSNIEEMKQAFNFCKKIIDDNSNLKDPVFGLCEETHKEKSWQTANSRQKLRFELFIDEDIQNRDELISHMKEVSSWVAL